jgi:hypothetical protein
MLRKISIALLLVASPALAQDAPPAGTDSASQAEAAPVAYKTKKVCRAIEVVGSAIPRMSCKTKKIPIKPAEQEADGGSHESSQDSPATKSE